MGLANLGGITFRINPTEISWSWNILTNVIETIGGRVVQIYGATLSDIVVTGSFGEQRIAGMGGDDSPGRGWRMADAFAKQIHDLMAASAPIPGGVKGYQPPKPIRFTYMTKGEASGHGFHDYDFMVYIRSLEDTSGQGVVSHQTGKFAYEYRLTLVPVVDNTTHLMDSFGPPQQSKQAAIEEALNRISNGIGWRLTRFNDDLLSQGNKDGLGNVTTPVNYAADLKAAILKQGGLTGITPPAGATTNSATAAATTGAPVIAKGSVAAPLTGSVLYSQAFGWPNGHPGIDLAQGFGSPIFAVADGVVVAAGPAQGFGQWIVIQHPALKVDSVYGHMPDNGGVLVHVGDTVTAGQQIGIVDSNGESTGDHLHMEIWTGGNGLADSQNKIDGAAWLSNQGIVIPALGTSGPIKVQS